MIPFSGDDETVAPVAAAATPSSSHAAASTARQPEVEEMPPQQDVDEPCSASPRGSSPKRAKLTSATDVAPPPVSSSDSNICDVSFVPSRIFDYRVSFFSYLSIFSCSP